MVGACSLLASRSAGNLANLRYFFWILAALNLLPGAGYFLFSGIFGFGDWYEVIRGLLHQAALRIGMTVFGAGLYFLGGTEARHLGPPLVPDRRSYNTVWRLPYYGEVSIERQK